MSVNRNLSFDSNRDLNVNLPETNMSSDLIDQIYKALRLLPEFDGNPNILTRFIHLCDQLVAQFVRNGPEYNLSNLSLINGILNKVTGSAARTINSNGIPETWTGIRSALINNFADHRDESSLYNDLSLLTQGSGTPQEFYEKCQNLFSIIMTYISLHESVSSTIEAKRSLYKKLTLQAYLRGLRDPLGARIRCMRPESIEIALEFVHEEMNTMYMQQRNERPSSSSFNPLAPVSVPSRAFNLKPLNTQASRPMLGWKPQMPFNRGQSRTQQIFNAPPPNYRAQGQGFRMPQPAYGYQPPRQSGPQPMSGVSHYVTKPFSPRPFHDWTKQGNPPPSNYFKTREINLNDYYDQQYYDDYYGDHHDENSFYGYNEYPEHNSNILYEQKFKHSEYAPAFVEEPTEEKHVEPEDFRKPSNSGELT